MREWGERGEREKRVRGECELGKRGMKECDESKIERKGKERGERVCWE